MPPARTLLSRSSNIATRQRVYRIPEGLEVDEIDHFEVRRFRVFFDDVVLMTYHRYRGKPFLAIVGTFIALGTAVGILIARQDLITGAITGGILGGPFLIAFILHLIFQMDEINVFSRRSRATLRFGFRKARARRLFDELAGAVRTAQGTSAQT